MFVCKKAQFSCLWFGAKKRAGEIILGSLFRFVSIPYRVDFRDTNSCLEDFDVIDH